MGEFTTTFYSARYRDLKHIYSGSPKVLKYRTSKHYPKRDLIKEKDENFYPHVPKSSEFVKEYKCHIPRAPAFRTLSRTEVDKIVERLSTQTIASKGISLRSVDAKLEDKAKQHSKYLGLQRLDVQKQNLLNDKITRHTYSTRLREFLTLRNRKKENYVYRKMTLRKDYS